MQSTLINQTTESDGAIAVGFRLQRLEVLNWGTFGQRPWSLDLAGGTALLTGENGSGKSTLVDALLTLLVPNRGRNYNQASGEARKKERNEKSYVQGAYARTRAEEAYESKSKYLREKGEISVLLAYFADGSLQEKVSLAQILWMDKGTVKKFYVIADLELTMQNIAEYSEISGLKRALKTNGVEIFDNFSKYAQQFRKRFGLASDKALDLFNQTVSIKQIDGLNSFVRDHMLEAADMREKIDGLVGSYENLTISHNSIQKAREQLEMLSPLTKESAKLKKIERELETLSHSITIVPAFFAAQKLALLQADLQKIEIDLAKVKDQKGNCDRTLTAQRQQAKELEFAIQNDSVGQQLQTLKQQIDQLQKEISQKQALAQQYDQLAQKLELEPYADQDAFYANVEKGSAIAQKIDAALADITTQRDALKLTQAELKQEHDQIEAELDSLRGRKSQIPKKNLDIRDCLIQSLNLSESDLPFSGELLQVRSEEKAWEGAIERLLRNFGLCLLVPEAHYRAVNAYVNKTNLGGRLVYYKVTPVAPDPTQRALDSSKVSGKVQVKQNDVFFEWMRSRLAQQFNYVCCEDVEQFQREQRAITQSGLIKHGQGRHEKDDRSRIDQRSRYILGWDNADKIRALEADLKAVNQRLVKVNKKISELEKQQKQQEQQRSCLQDFTRFTDFSTVDWKSSEQDQQVLVEQKQKLEASSSKLKQLEAQLKAVQAEIDKTSTSRDQAQSAIGRFESRQQDNLKAQTQCRHLSETVSTNEIRAFKEQQAKKLKAYELTLETIVKDESDIKDSLQAQLRTKEQKRETAKTNIVSCLVRFSNTYREETLELGSRYEDLPEYLKLKEQIEKDDLPRHEKRFKQLMDEKVVMAISMFRGNLEKQEDEIESVIRNINESLRQIAYTDATYIELCCAKTKHKEIRDFQDRLRSCLGDVARQSPEDQEARFQRIRTQLIERFKESERWTKLVTDVRNWLDFSVSERYREDDTEKEHHTDSSGKSGGQKVKLAYTILASAIAYQFGLTKTEASGLSSYLTNNRSFRFVVIDEAFGRSDDSNARYAMELFKNLDLQLLVITPMGKINVLTPYIDTLHLVSNSEKGDYSKVHSIEKAEYERRREASMVVLGQS